MIAGAFFYMFALVMIASAALVVTVRQPVAAVLFLILCFFNAAGLFLLLGAEFLAFIMLIVYVGAVAVLFLFVVMMLDIQREQSPRKASRCTFPVCFGVGGVMLVEMAVALWSWPAAKLAQAAVQPEATENTRALGRVLYTAYAYPFQVSGLILLVAMIGAITLTLRKGRPKKTQKMWDQLDRSREDVIEIRKVKSGEGAL